MGYQGSLYIGFKDLLPYKHAEPAAFLTPTFAMTWKQTMQTLQTKLWGNTPWKPRMVLELYIDASAHGFGDVLLGNKQILALYNSTNPQSFHHSSVVELEGLIRSLPAFKHLLVGKEFYFIY